MACTRPATGANTSVYITEETTCGVTPNSPVWDHFRFTGSIPSLTRDNLTSSELDGSREVSGLRLGQFNPNGDVNVELYYGAHDAIISALMQGSWVSGTTEAGLTITVDADAATFTRASGDFTTNYAVGDLVKFPGLTGSGNSDPVTITSVSALTITADGASLTNETSATTDIVGGDKLNVGTSKKSFSLMVVYDDLNNGVGGVDIITGCEVTAASFDISVNALVTGSFSFIGRDYMANTTEPAGSTFNDVNTERPFASFDGALIQDSAQIGFVTSITPEMDNTGEAAFVVGKRGPSHISYGRMSNTFGIEAFFLDYTLFEKFANEEEGSMVATLKLDGNAMSFHWPRFIYTEGSPSIDGESDISVSASAQALKDSDLNTSLIIQRVS